MAHPSVSPPTFSRSQKSSILSSLRDSLKNLFSVSVYFDLLLGTYQLQNGKRNSGGNETPFTAQPSEESEAEYYGMQLVAKDVNQHYDKRTRQYVDIETDTLVHELASDPAFAVQCPVDSRDLVDPYACHAFTLYREKSSKSQIKEDFFVRSPHLKRLLGDSIRERDQYDSAKGQASWVNRLHCPSLNCFFAHGLSFEFSYHCLIRARRKLQTLLENLENAKNIEDREGMIARVHLSFLLTCLQKFYGDTIPLLDSLLKQDEITFNLFWVFGVPGTLFYTQCNSTSEPRVVRLLDMHSDGDNYQRLQEDSRYWDLSFEYVDYNRKYSVPALDNSRPIDAPCTYSPKFGLVTNFRLIVNAFPGVRKISTLPVYPLEYHPQLDELKSFLIERGRRWASLQGDIHHMRYVKDGLTSKSKSEAVSNFSMKSSFLPLMSFNLYFRTRNAL